MPGGARLGDKAQCPLDAHGCPACPHPTTGPAVAGSPDINTNGRPALRDGDNGIHAACCGPNTWQTAAGSGTVFFNGKPAVRIGDATKHCGGSGRMIEGSSNVMIGGGSSSGSGGGGSGNGSSGSSSGGDHSNKSSNTNSPANRSAGGNAASNGSAAPGTGSSPPSSSNDESTESKPDDANVHVVKAQLQSPGGTPLAFEQVVLLKAGTDEQVAGPFTTDATGAFGVLVPEAGQFDVQLVDDGSAHYHKSPLDADVATHLHCQFFENGLPAAGEVVTITGSGGTCSVTLGGLGEMTLAAEPGPYELRIRGQTFKAHTMTLTVLRGSRSGYQFAITGDLDEAAIEQARGDRYSPSERFDGEA